MSRIESHDFSSFDISTSESSTELSRSLVFISHEEDHLFLSSKSPAWQLKSVIPRWISRNIDVFSNRGRRHNRNRKRTHTCATIWCPSGCYIILPLIHRGIQPSAIVQIWWVFLQTVALGVLWPWLTHIWRCFVENWLLRLIETWVTLNFSKTKGSKVPEVCWEYNAQQMTTGPVQAGSQRLVRHKAIEAILSELVNPWFYKFKKLLIKFQLLPASTITSL